jgi:crotonobetainyl-CoA:carnitine CoA-transferase CaiB-like acyl-CoA transferase
VNVAQAFLTSGQVPARQGNAHLQIVPYQLFATADSWLVLAVGNDGQWQRFCQVADRPDLASDPRFLTNTQRVQLREILVPIVDKVMRSRTTSVWLESLTSANVPHAPVWNYQSVFESPQQAARGMRLSVRDPDGREVDLIGSPFHIEGTPLPEPRMPPGLGDDTDAVLSELLGYDATRLAMLREKGVV